jgi:hypothetical protein
LRDVELPSTARRIVVLATADLDAAAAQAIAEVLPPDAAVVVVAPSLSSPVKYWTQDVSARRRAQERLDASLPRLAAAGVKAQGEIGDDDPLLALEDAVAVHRADAVVIATPPSSERGWLEQGLPAAARSRLGVPVASLVVGGSGAAEEDERPQPREHPTRDAAVVIVLGFLATFGTVGTFLLAMHDVDYGVLVAWACFCDVVPKVLFAWAGWRLYLKRRPRELRVASAPRYERGPRPSG